MLWCKHAEIGADMSFDNDETLDEQVWELMNTQTPWEIAETLGLDRSEAARIFVRLRRTRGNPYRASVYEQIAKLRAIRF
jgi:hypothetical protein